ncbi:unnamed protein product [Sphagnum compactum]
MAAAPIIKSLECSSAASCRRLLCRSAATLGVLVDEQQSQCIARRKLSGSSWNPRVDTTACGKNCCLRGAASFARGGGRAVVRARTRTRRRSGCLQQLGVRAELQELAQNEVLVSALVAGAGGQLTKSISSVISGNGFNWKLILKSGGMPSSHSAVVSAAATALAFERGLSDGLFGFSCIMAIIVIHDAQGVRNAVGKHAKVLNTMAVTYGFQPEAPMAPQTASQSAIGSELAQGPVRAELAFMESVDSPSTAPWSSATATLQAQAADQPSGSSGSSQAPTKKGISEFEIVPSGAANATNGSYTRSADFFELAEQLPSMKGGEVDIQELGKQSGWELIPLKESIGHTKLEVLVGTFWGILVSYLLHQYAW